MASFIGTAGSDQGDLRSDSKIGIKTNPSGLLHVAGSAYTSLIRSDGGLTIGYGDVGSDALLVDGRVGIGTSIPGEVLEITKDDDVDVYLKIHARESDCRTQTAARHSLRSIYRLADI
jgi:hypothetical protein